MRTLISIICVITIFAGVALAGGKQQNPKTVTITLTVEQVDVVLSGLGKLPYDQSAAVIQAIYNQANRQLYPPPTETKADSSAKKVTPKKN
jgi:hypothetical protein